ncbi:hypothetical protein TNCV_698991 [Trichonephila clavipes]|nr:hypothetical protein TNCV_698991 [Trichonephila clavipes]
MPSDSRNRQVAQFMMPMDFCTDSIGGVHLSANQTVVYGMPVGRATARGADFPCIDEPATVSISSLTVSAAFRRVLGRPLRGLSSKQPVASNFRKSFSPQLHLSTDLYLRMAMGT